MKWIATLLLVVSFYGTQAQQVLFKENFDQYPGLNIPGWNTSKHTDRVGWRTSDMYNLYCSYSKVPSHKYWARVASISGCYGIYGGPRNNSNVFMSSPSINLSQVSGGAVLRFDSYFNGTVKNGKAEKATVEVSINNGASWTVLMNVPKGASLDSFVTHYINMSAYVGYSNILLGFRYSDAGEDQKNGGWTVDNIELFRPEQKDLALIHFYPEQELKGYRVINNPFIHTGVVQNLGLDTIKEFVVNYQNSGGAVIADTFSNVSISPFASYAFSHSMQNVITQIGLVDITAWVSTTGDNNSANDSQFIKMNGVQFVPQKKVLIEEGTGNWNMFAPRGYTYMDAVAKDVNACLVSVHGGDPMEYDAYSDYLYYLDYYSAQYFLLDREVSPDETNFFKLVGEYAEHFGFADLEMHGYISKNNRAEVGVTVKPAVDIKGDFRLAMILTEDGVHGTGNDWRQYNMWYSGGKNGAMGGYENRPDTIPAEDMKYNYVARVITPAPDGGTTFQKELKVGSSYWHKFSVDVDPNWDKTQLKAIVVLLRDDDTAVLNSNCLEYFLSVEDTELDKEYKVGLYPNPSNTITNLEFELSSKDRVAISVYDVSGRVQYRVYSNAVSGVNKVKIPTSNLPQGMYILELKGNSIQRSLKLQVWH